MITKTIFFIAGFLLLVFVNLFFISIFIQSNFILTLACIIGAIGFNLLMLMFLISCIFFQEER